MHMLACRFVLLHDQFIHYIREQIMHIFLYVCVFSHAAIQVQFLQNTSTVDEGNSMAPLTIQLLLTPADAILRFNIIVTLSVSSGSATGTVHGRVKITPTQVYCTVDRL